MTGLLRNLLAATVVALLVATATLGVRAAPPEPTPAPTAQLPPMLPAGLQGPANPTPPRMIGQALEQSAPTSTHTIAAVPVLAEEEPPARVAVVSKVLDIFTTGNSIGLPTLYGLGSSIVGSAISNAGLPPELTPVREQLLLSLTVPPDLLRQMAEANGQGLTALKEAVGPFAVINPGVNALLELLAAAFTDTATTAGPLIQPLDRTAFQIGALLLVFREP